MEVERELRTPWLQSLTPSAAPHSLVLCHSAVTQKFLMPTSFLSAPQTCHVHSHFREPPPLSTWVRAGETRSDYFTALHNTWSSTQTGPASGCVICAATRAPCSEGTLQWVQHAVTLLMFLIILPLPLWVVSEAQWDNGASAQAEEMPAVCVLPTPRTEDSNCPMSTELFQNRFVRAIANTVLYTENLLRE